MAILEIVLYPDETLREVSTPVEIFDSELIKLIEDMSETMYDAPGIGLAAPQIGINKRIAVVDLGTDEESKRVPKRYVLINPKITDKSGFIKYEEGCLSIPGVREFVERPSKIIVTAKDEHGKDYELEAEGLLAVCIQHEIDHLNGVLFTDHLSGLKKKLANNKLKKLFGTAKG